MRATLDGQLEGVGAGAVKLVGILVDIDTCGSVVSTMPGVAVACGLREDVVGAPLEGQLEGVGAGAVELVGVLVDVGT